MKKNVIYIFSIVFSLLISCFSGTPSMAHPRDQIELNRYEKENFRRQKEKNSDIDGQQKIAKAIQKKLKELNYDLSKFDIKAFDEATQKEEPFFYGNPTAEKEKINDLVEIITGGLECGLVPIPVGICVNCKLFGAYPANFWPKFSYYLPVHKIEVTEYPGHTAYVRGETLKPFMQKNANWIKPLLKENVLNNLRKEEKKIDSQAAEKILKARDDQASDHIIWSSAKVQAGSNLYVHIFDTGIMDIKNTFKFFWGHDGAELPQRDPATACASKQCQTGNKKRKVNDWLSESIMDVWHYPQSSIAKKSPESNKDKIKAITFIEEGKANQYTGNAINISQSVSDFSEKITGDEKSGSKNNKKLAGYIKDGDSKVCEGNEGKYTEEVMGEKLSKCLNFDDESSTSYERILHLAKGPIVGFVPEVSHPRAALTALWRGLFWVNAYEDDNKEGTYKKGPIGKYTYSSLDDDCKGPKLKYHPFYNEDKLNGKIPRSRLQLLTRNSKRYGDTLKGCKEFKKHKQFIPALTHIELRDKTREGSNSAETEIFDSKNHGNNTTYVQWNYFKNCLKDFETFLDWSSKKDIWY